MIKMTANLFTFSQMTTAVCLQFQVNAVKSLAQILRRYTGLNHLAQAARAVLQNSSQVSQMLNDLNKVDFVNVQEQVFQAS